MRGTDPTKSKWVCPNNNYNKSKFYVCKHLIIWFVIFDGFAIINLILWYIYYDYMYYVVILYIYLYIHM
jgi:hypothetical protein